MSRIRPTKLVYMLASLWLVVIALAVGSSQSVHAAAVTIDPSFSSSYTSSNLGAVPGLHGTYGGLTFQSNDPNTLLIMGNADDPNAALFSIGVTRGSGLHITGFTGTATQVAAAARADGGLDFAPNGDLLYPKYAPNEIGEIKAGSSQTDKVVGLSVLGADSGISALGFVPNGFPGAGELKTVSYDTGGWYTASISPDASGTYDITAMNRNTTIFGGPEGFAFVPAGSPIFTANSTLQVEYHTDELSTYQLDSNGNPEPATRKQFAAGVDGPTGIVFDPETGDALISEFNGRRIEEIQGFARTAQPVLWGNFNCDSQVDAFDALDQLSPAPRQANAVSNCPSYGAAVVVDGDNRLWADWNCDNAATPSDVISILRFLAGVPKTPDGCPAVGSSVQLQQLR